MAEAEPTSPWQPTSAPEIEALVLMMPPIGGRGQQEVADARLVGLGVEMQPVAQHRRNDAGRAIGRRRDDAAAGGVLLVDGHGVDREPVIGEQRVGPVLAPFFLQLLVQLAGAAPHLEPARHDAVLRQAAVDAARASPPRCASSPASSSSRDMRVSSLARFIAAMERPLLAAMSSISTALRKG